MCHKSPLMKSVCTAAWLITALSAINVGLCPLGFNLFKTQMLMMQFPALVNPLHYLVGLAGLVSLYALVMECMHKCSHACKTSGM